MDIRQLTNEEINQIEWDFYDKVNYLFPRNGIERIVIGQKQYLRLLILDYPLNEQWQQDNQLLELIDFIINKYSSFKNESKPINEVVKKKEINNIIEIDSIGGAEYYEIETLYNLLLKEGFEFEVIYEELSIYNIGATGGGTKLVLNLIGHAANLLAVKDFFKKYYPYIDIKEDINSYNIEMIKKDISNKYNIYENQLTLESHSYNESNEQMQYVFHTRYDRFIAEVRDGKIMKKMKS